MLAEKASTAVELAEANTRVRDYADLYTLTGRHEVSYGSMRAALAATAAYRGVELSPLSGALGDLSVVRQSAYAAFRARLGPDGAHLPTDFSDVVHAVVAFLDPVLRGEIAGGVWDPGSRTWRS